MIARGSVVGIRAGFIDARLPATALGDGVAVHGTHGTVRGTVGAVHADRVVITPYGALDGIAIGNAVVVDPAALNAPLGMALLGRAIAADGHVLDDGAALRSASRRIDGVSLAPSQRSAIAQPLWTGVRAIDGLLTIGRGARVGLFGAPGVGKSTLLQSVVRGVRADAVVVGLIGERGREAERWIAHRDARTSIVCATSDRPAAERVRAARVTLAQAHALRSRGLHVLLVLDSLARFAAALRELAVAHGESVGRGGYPPSVFAELAQLVEIAGAARAGSISMIATVLSDGDENDPVSEASRSLLDGHVTLSPRLAQAGHFPAIDVERSVSRTMSEVVTPEHAASARSVRGALAALASTRDARALGIVPADPAVLRAVAAEPAIEAFLRQGEEVVNPEATRVALTALADNLEGTSWTSRAI